MSTQTPKILINTGVEGDESTGDTLYDGGTSLNTNLDSLYNVFGDFRLFANDSSAGVAILHPSGYYQKHTRSYYQTTGRPVQIGSLHDVSVTRDGPGDLTVELPIGLNSEGESIEFVNIDGSVDSGNGTNFIIKATGADSITGLAQELLITKPNQKVVMWVSRASPAGSVWSYKIESLFGDKSIPYDVNIRNVPPGVELNAPLFPKTSSDSVKHMMFVREVGGTNQRETSETLLMVNNGDPQDLNVYSTEYARVRLTTGLTDPEQSDNLLYNIRYAVVNGYVQVFVENIGSDLIDVRIKAIESIGAQ